MNDGPKYDASESRCASPYEVPKSLTSGRPTLCRYCEAMCPSKTFLKYVGRPKWLSMMSRQLEPSIRIEFHRHSVHSSLWDSGMSGMRTAGSGGLFSWSCQTNSRPPRTSVVHARVRAVFGVRLA